MLCDYSSMPEIFVKRNRHDRAIIKLKTKSHIWWQGSTISKYLLSWTVGVGVDRGLTSSSDNRGHYSGRGEDDKDITFLNSYHHLP